MKPLSFHPDAEIEMIEAAAYYEAQQKNLGKHFLASVQEAARKIAIFPDAYPVIQDNVQRCLTKTFPYAVLFKKTSHQLIVIAVMHLHRNPSYWNQRNK
jgi:toxin ParE1/3/4